jgi:hypothetical protein
MATARDLTAAIKAFLVRPGEVPPDRIREAAALYAELCRAVNERLRVCAAYLQQGRRTEAIHHAEAAPDVLSLAADLDLPHFAEWVGVCQDHGFDLPERLQLDIARQVNEAYARERELEPLLRKQRAMALARAPLRHRIEVQRALLAADPGQVGWEDDLLALERARVLELAAEAQQAYNAASLPALRAALDELEQPAWRITIPPEQLAAVQRQTREVTVAAATQRLRDLLPQLDEAYIAMSEAECADLVERWERIVADARLTVPGDLAERFAPIKQWVEGRRREAAQEQAFARACGVLEQALGRDVPLPELWQLHAETLQHDRMLPEELEYKFRHEIQSRQLARRRRMRIALLAATPVVLAAAVGVYLAIQRGLDEINAQAYAEDVAAITAERAFDRGESLFARIESESPRLLEHPALAAARTEFDAAAQAAREQRARVGELLAGLDAALARDDPADDAWITATRRQLVEAETLTAELRDPNLAEAVRRRAQAFAPRREAWQSAIDATFQQRLQAWATAEFQGLDTTRLDVDPAGFARTIERLTRELDVIRLTPHVSSTALTAAQFYQQRLAAYASAAADRLAAAAAGNAADAAIARALEVAGVPARYAARLVEAAAVQRDSARAADLSRAPELVPHWEAIQRWEALLRGWDGVPLPDSPAELSDRLAAVTRFRSTLPDGLRFPAERALADYLRRAEQSLSARGVWKGGFADYLRSTPAIATLCMLEAVDGSRFYVDCDAEFTRIAAGLAGEVYTSLSLRNTQRAVIPVGPDVDGPQPSPQRQLADELLDAIAALSADTWRGFGLLAAERIRQAGAVDPILRVAMLDRVLEYVSQADPDIAPTVQALRDEISALGVVDADWVAPDDPAARRLRGVAQRLLEHTDYLAELRERLLDQRAELVDRLSVTPVGYGVALVEQGAWVVRTNVLIRSGTEAWIIAEDRARDGYTLRRIGVANSGTIAIAASDMVGALEGTLVFLWQPRE